MADIFIYEHLPFVILPLYFILYTTHRMCKHWSDGKEPAKTSTKRFAFKLFLTFSLSILDLIHIADYSPGQHYSAADMSFRVAFYIFSAVSWLFSAGLVTFDYYRRLESQWRGQRIFWILELFSYIIIVLINAIGNEYDFEGTEFYRFYLIQIVCHAISVVFCAVLTYFALFRPNDFAVIGSDVYLKLSSGSLVEESMKEKDGMCFKVSCTGYKSKVVGSVVATHYKFSVSVNGSKYAISKTFQDFEALDKALKRSVYTFEERLPDLEYSKILALGVQERGKELARYLNSVSSVDFMTNELISFLQIEGPLKDSLQSKNLDMHSQKFRQDFINTSESFSVDYFEPRLDPGAIDSIFTNSTSLQWLAKVKVLCPSGDVSQDVDFCVKFKIPKISFRKTLGFKLQDFCNLHKRLCKVYAPASLYFINKSFPSSLKDRDQSLMNKIRVELEHYMLEILNDPAFLCQEVLDFIKCDTEVTHLLEYLPEIHYQITDQATWEQTISEDSSHITLYRLHIRQHSPKDSSEKEWQFLRRYREFDALHRRILSRHCSKFLKTYANRLKISEFSLPSLPRKTIAPLSSSSEIEDRKVSLVNFMQALCENPLVSCSYAFREFVDSMDS